MFRIDNGKDITPEEFLKYVSPHIDKVNNYIIKNIIPEVCAYYIVTGYEDNAIWENAYDTHIGTVLDMFNIEFNNTISHIKHKTTKILLNKYGYYIINENPLQLKHN